MWRWLFWATRMLATALLLSFLSIWTTGYIVNSYVETILKQLNLPLETKPFALSGVWGKLWGASDVPQAGEDPQRAWDPAADRAEGSVSPPDRTQGSFSLSPNSEETDDHPSGTIDADSSYTDHSESPAPADQADEHTVDGAVPVFGGQQQSSGMSEEQRQTTRSIMSKLNGVQLSALTQYLADGITAEERIAIEQLLRPSLSDTELEQLFEMIDGRTE